MLDTLKTKKMQLARTTLQLRNLRAGKVVIRRFAHTVYSASACIVSRIDVHVSVLG